ncbi:MAG: helix-turn-helix transcriptional regulator [Rhodobacteraceae bacterium]|jgi:DNA-binding transcriptional ArsR family regulator|nr:helix-turn-helix transcriptional regulator [Paracoccaceae bacterium]
MENKNTLRLPDVFAALGDPVRFALVERLLAEPEMAAGDLGAGFGISAPAISRHLAVLHRAGLVTRRADRQRRLYAIAPEAMRQVAAWTLSHREFLQGSVARLDALMAHEERDDD